MKNKCLRIELIYRYMNCHKLNKRQFAEKCGFSCKTLDKILNNNTKIRLTTVIKLYNGLDNERNIFTF